MQQLRQLKARHDCIADVRGMGLLVGMKLTREGAPIVKRCLQKGFLINCIQERILRFIPPLTIAEKEIDALIACLDELLEE
jgi:acetylornithine aminotransferase